MNNLKYLVVGTGGVGGSIAAFLTLAGKDVACIARGEALKVMQRQGMAFHSDMKGDHPHLPVKAYSQQEYNEKADVIFVTVKGYSIDSIGEIIRKAAHENTVVIPLLNVYGTGRRIKDLVPEINVLDGCIYIVGFKSGVGEISQLGEVFHLVFGVPKWTDCDKEVLDRIVRDLRDSGIKTTLSSDIDRDTFIKWSYISAMSVTGAYYDIPMGPIQHPGKERDTFIGLTKESTAIGEKLGIDFGCDMVEHHLGVMDSLDPGSTASMQKDLKAGNQSEIKGQLFDMIALGKELGVATPVYDEVVKKFKDLA